MHICETSVESFKILSNDDASLPILAPQTAIFGFTNGIENNVYKITNHILLIFKLHVYKSRKRGTFPPGMRRRSGVSIRSHRVRGIADHAKTSSRRRNKYVIETDLFETSFQSLIGT